MKAGRSSSRQTNEKRKAEAENRPVLRQLSNRLPVFREGLCGQEGKPVNAKIMVRGEPNQLGPEVPRGFLTSSRRESAPEEKGSGRLELGKWVTDAKNPLTARVIVNRVWLWQFRKGIVATPDDSARAVKRLASRAAGLPDIAIHRERMVDQESCIARSAFAEYQTGQRQRSEDALKDSRTRTCGSSIGVAWMRKRSAIRCWRIAPTSIRRPAASIRSHPR